MMPEAEIEKVLTAIDVEERGSDDSDDLADFEDLRYIRYGLRFALGWEGTAADFIATYVEG